MLSNPLNYESRVRLFRQPTNKELDAIKEYLTKNFKILPDNVKPDFSEGKNEIVVYGKGEIKKWLTDIVYSFLKYRFPVYWTDSLE